ncbi:FAD-binding oxidoreductase [Catelliglobosispora koreensis]|uniref:FAD-binding oxidoreductase n=1 Tax=Catelliglobosispora koreensis TaxID=129052 RepID=UPI00037B88A1|nr:FAD-binding oxidoreductase [Catelliglobosispora koreensis]
MELIQVGDPGYDDNRTIFNAMIDRKPSVIALCRTKDEVAEAIRYAREHGLEIAVRGGGHSVAGMALTEGGLVIDLRHLNHVEVDPKARTAKVQGGATMSNLDRATEPFGLATTGGRVSTTGVGGFSLGGGTGWLDRKFGLACDNLLEAELVTADGRFVKASPKENPELFWALHGGGGNFGVATELTFRLHPLSTVAMAMLLFQPERGPEMVAKFRDFIEAGSDDVNGAVIYMTGPPEEFVPAHMQGKKTLAVLVMSAGDPAEIEPMTQLGHEGGMQMELPYADLQCMVDDPPGHRNYWSAEHLASLPDEAVRAFCDTTNTMIVPSASQGVLFPAGGAAGRETADYPVPWRAAPWVVHPFGLWDKASDDERGKAWVRESCAAVKPWSMGSVYLNFIGNEGQARVESGFGAANYERLKAVKREFDPRNVFHLNHNISPE